MKPISATLVRVLRVPMLVAAPAAFLPVSLQAAEPRERSLGRRVADFTLTDARTGDRWTLSKALEDHDVVVLYFNSTECPVTNRYLPTLAKLRTATAERGVAIVTVNSNRHDSLEEVKRHAREFELDVPVLRDARGDVARSLAATRTAEAIVLDSSRKLRYRGVVDNRFDRGITRPRATRSHLANAIDAVLRGRTVATPITDVVACPLNLEPQESRRESPTTVTYAEHAAAIIQRRCQACHRPKGVGPFELMTYEDAKTWSTSIREVLAEDLMPPWHADAPHGHFSNDRSLTDEEYATLLDWIDDGTVEGDRSKLPAPRTFSDSWTIGTPDVVVEMEKSIEVPAETPELGVPYKYVWAGEPFDRERWVQAAEVRPGATEVVHHASVYVVPAGVSIKLVDDGRPGGVLSDLFSPLDSLPHLVSFVPGDNAFERPNGLAMRIPKGARLLFEMHYTPNGKAASDRTRVALRFAKRPPTYEVVSGAALNYWFSIPPGAARHTVRARTSKFRHDSALLTMNPHMHYRGKSFRYELVHPSGKREPLLDVPNYDFEWQSTYVLAKPIEVPAGAHIACTAVFDNSKENPVNPDPTVRVEWGEQTWQEMMLGSFEYHEKRPPMVGKRAERKR